MPNFVPIDQTVVKLLKFMAIFNMAIVHHFGFFEFQTLSADRV